MQKQASKLAPAVAVVVASSSPYHGAFVVVALAVVAVADVAIFDAVDSLSSWSPVVVSSAASSCPVFVVCGVVVRGPILTG